MLDKVTFNIFFLTVLQIYFKQEVYCEAETNFMKCKPKSAFTFTSNSL